MFKIVELREPTVIDVDVFESVYFKPELRCCWRLDEYHAIIEDGKLVALGFLRGWDDDWDDICLGVAVLPEYRRQGYAEIMCRRLEVIAERRGLERIRLHVDPDNVAARRLYRKLGYLRSGIRENGDWILYRRLV